MNPNQPQDDFPEVQAAIYRVALSLDSFLLNGIPYGVFQDTLFPGFLKKVADNLLTPLASLEHHARHAPVANQPKIRQVLALLREKCQQLIDLVTGLRAFRKLPLPQVRATVSRIALLREECAQLLQELEAYFQTPKPFYQSRPSYSTALVNNFLANLERVFEKEWATSKST
ncbi:MAG: hypothetical protein JO112_18550 [Planctomycetes bacterium]|nr:hypothetical protein [Planctomycetota bacterium]